MSYHLIKFRPNQTFFVTTLIIYVSDTAFKMSKLHLTDGFAFSGPLTQPGPVFVT